jgi:hypothetical protein
MSLNKTLDRLFDEIRREAKRNPEFADRLDAVLQRHDSRREVPDEVLEDVAKGDDTPTVKAKGKTARTAGVPAGKSDVSKDAGETPAVQDAPEINPAGVFRKEGEEGLAAALADHDLSALRALVAEHNLDPSGVTPSLTRDELAAHIIAQAKRRAERDEKMFDY